MALPASSKCVPPTSAFVAITRPSLLCLLLPPSYQDPFSPSCVDFYSLWVFGIFHPYLFFVVVVVAVSLFVCFLFFTDFIYLTERKRESTSRGSGRQREREKQAPH